MLGTCWKSKICDLAVAKTSIKWRCYWILGKIVLLDGYLMDRDRLVVAKRRPLRPSPGLQPDTRRWRAFVCRPSGRPASTKHTSATAARRSPVPCARRPRSRLGSPARLRRSGGRHRFRQASPAFIHARRTSVMQSFLPYFSASTARLRPAPIRITPHHSHLAHTAKRSRHRA